MGFGGGWLAECGTNPEDQKVTDAKSGEHVRQHTGNKQRSGCYRLDVERKDRCGQRNTACELTQQEDKGAKMCILVMQKSVLAKTDDG